LDNRYAGLESVDARKLLWAWRTPDPVQAGARKSLCHRRLAEPLSAV